MKASLETLFTQYSADHQHPTNRLTHKIAIPLIVFHIIAMTDWVKLITIPGTAFTLSLGHVAYALAIGWYLSQDLKLGVLMALLMGACFPLGWMVPRMAVVAIAVVGWLVQLAGHLVWEKKQPSFFTNLLQALVGPVFFVAVLIGDWPKKPAELPASRPA